MAGSDSPQPQKPQKPVRAAAPPRKPLQVMHISRKEEKEILEKEAEKPKESAFDKSKNINPITSENPGSKEMLASGPSKSRKSITAFKKEETGTGNLEGLTIADLLKQESFKEVSFSKRGSTQTWDPNEARSVDDFDFDEDAFLAALDENEPIGTTGEIARGSIIGAESDGVYVDIGGKAPGFMPKNECGLGVITNIKERFPKGLEIEVLVTREQNADGMVTVSCRALALRKSWEKVLEMAKEGKVAQVKINGFNRGGVTCDIEGLRGFIPRSQLADGANHEKLVGKTLGVAFLEVNPDNRKLVLSEKRATTAARFSQLEVGQLIEGKISALKPYGYFVDLDGVSGLLHQSTITNGSIRSLREVFEIGESIKAIITELDPGRGRISLNTALLEGLPGEILVEKNKIMEEATDRANKARNILRQKEQSAG